MLRSRQSHPQMRKSRPHYRTRLAALSACWLAMAALPAVRAQVADPGPRSGPAAAGTFFSTLNANEQLLFSQAMGKFAETDSVTGTIEEGRGLGPTFNGNSCAQCHAQPAIGGSSPGLISPQNPIPNPQVALATLDGATNFIPSFITANGPVREARFILTDSTKLSSPLDGGVHALYTVKGRTDASGCNLGQPPFPTELSRGNVIFRIPTPTFGLGLVEDTPDATLKSNLNATASARAALGIGGSFNAGGNDGSITRFGWKAQNKSLLVFAGEAYNVEQGVTSESFPNERSATMACTFNATPEDSSNILNNGSTTGTLSEMSSDLVNFAAFMRLLAPPTPAVATKSVNNGSKMFKQAGCNLCHTASLTTGTSPFTGMSHYTYNPYSDFALHHMGANLADGISQGAAGPDQFRTAPLWGLGQRLFFLHDGRTTDLVAAIQAHSSSTSNCTTVTTSQSFNVLTNTTKLFAPGTSGVSCGSEANKVIDNYNALTPSEQQDLLNFLRSL